MKLAMTLEILALFTLHYCMTFVKASCPTSSDDIEAYALLAKVESEYFKSGPSRFRNTGEEDCLEYLFSLYEKTSVNRSCAIFDFGANVGNYAKFLLESQSKSSLSCDIHAYEPNPVTYRELLRRVPRSKRLFTYHQGVGDKGGYMTLHYGTSDKKGDKTKFDIGASFVRSGRGKRHAKVKVTTVAEALPEDQSTDILLLKFDIEGLELRVLRSLDGILRKGEVRLIQYERSWRVGVKGHSLETEVRIFAQYNYSVFLMGVDGSTPRLLQVWPSDGVLKVFEKLIGKQKMTYNFVAVRSDIANLVLKDLCKVFL